MNIKSLSLIISLLFFGCQKPTPPDLNPNAVVPTPKLTRNGVMEMKVRKSLILQPLTWSNGPKPPKLLG
jgi:hypothetical protein